MGEPSRIPDDVREQSRAFQRQASQAQPSLAAEFLDFLQHNKKWWLTPIVAILLLMGLMVILLQTPAAPFIYSLF